MVITVERRERDGWHVGKEIPLALMFAFIMQTAALIWWAATFQADFKNLTRQVEGIAGRQFTQKDGLLLIAESKANDLDHDRRIDAIELRLKDLEFRIRAVDKR